MDGFADDLPLKGQTGSPSILADGLVDRMARSWRQGIRERVEDVLADLPALAEDREVVLRLIYEEICLRRDANVPATSTEMARRFPHLGAELAMLHDCDRLFDDDPQAPEFPEVGDTLDGFHLVAELGRGARGRVYLAMQPALADRPVVLKVTPLRGTEHRSLARLQHTHVVPLLSSHDLADRGLRLLCLPYLGGTTLDALQAAMADLPPSRRQGRDLLRSLDAAGNSVPEHTSTEGPAQQFLVHTSYERAVCWIVACLADALDHAHRRGLVHLDVKPANVLLTADAMPMLLDFHLARPPVTPNDPPPDGMGGTPGFMAPEQEAAMGCVRQGASVMTAVDARADVYASGLLLYQMLAGEPPQGHNRTAIRRLRRINPRVGAGLADLVARCLDADPSQRYASAQEMADDLRRHLDDQPLRGVRNRSPAERWAKWRRRHPHTLSRTVSAVVALLVLTMASWAAWIAEDARVDEARAALQHATRQRQDGLSAEASRTLEQGLHRLGAVGVLGTMRPDLPRLRTQMARQLDQTRREGRLATLQMLADQARWLLAAGPASDDDKATLALEASLSRLWEGQNLLDASMDPAAREQARADLLDLAILRADLLSRDHDLANRTRSLEILDEAEAACGTSVILLRKRQQLAQALGRHDEAAKAAELASRLEPRTAWDHYATGRALLDADDLDAAAEALDRAVELDPGGLWPQFYRGQCALRRRRYAEALDAFSACVALAPEQGLCRAYRGLAYRGLGDRERADRDRDAAKRMSASPLPSRSPLPQRISGLPHGWQVPR